MREAQKVDGNHHPTGLRSLGAIGGEISLPDGVTRDTWHRLMQAGNTGVVVDEYNLNLPNLRDDISPGRIEGWEVKILNAGYVSHNVVEDADSTGAIRLANRISFYKELPASGVEWVLFPEMVFEWSFVVKGGGAGAVKLGMAVDDAYSPSVKPYFSFAKATGHQSIRLRIAEIDKVFYQIGTGTGKTDIGWGEYILENV